MKHITFMRSVGVALLAAGAAFAMAAPVSAAPVEQRRAADLSAAMTSLNAAATTRPAPGTGWYVDEATKALVVEVHGSDQGVTNWASGLGAGSVKVQHVAEAPKPLWNLIGGQAITTGGSRCSLGFNARNSAGTRYVI